MTEKLDNTQIDQILEKLVPAIAAPPDHDFFRGTLRIALEQAPNSTAASLLIKNLLDQHQSQQTVDIPPKATEGAHLNG